MTCDDFKTVSLRLINPKGMNLNDFTRSELRAWCKHGYDCQSCYEWLGTANIDSAELNTPGTANRLVNIITSKDPNDKELL